MCDFFVNFVDFCMLEGYNKNKEGQYEKFKSTKKSF